MSFHNTEFYASRRSESNCVAPYTKSCRWNSQHELHVSCYAPRTSRSMSSENTNASPEPSKIRVLLADDSNVMLDAIARLLGDSPEVDLVAVTTDFGEAVRFTSELQPDVVVIDLRMAQKARAEARRLRELNATLRILAVTAATLDEEMTDLAAKLEADKLLDKMRLYEELVPTILELAKNKSS
jgi:CheY-like chemotaxis protein